MLRNINNITIVGAGNIGTYLTCVCACKGYKTTLYTSNPNKIQNTIKVVDSDNNVLLSTSDIKPTNNLKEAIENADMIFVTYPSFMFDDFSKQISSYIHPGQYIGVIPGTGGAEFYFKNCIDLGAILFGLQRVPIIARLKEYGHIVCAEGKKDSLFLASIPNSYTNDLSLFISILLDIKCVSLPNYLSVTLTPSNPILHTTRLCSLFSDYKEGKVYSRNPLFYGEWNDESSDLLIKCDEELQSLIHKLDKLDLSYVKSLKQHYESNTIEKMTLKLSSIESLHNIYSPMIAVDGGYIPDFNSRYFTADFPYGLAIIQKLGTLANVDMPNINNTLSWYMSITHNESTFDFSKFEINSLDDLYNYYKR